jgi:hypothetical protein
MLNMTMAIHCLIFLTTLLSIQFVRSASISLGNFRTRQHQLQGTVTLLSESVIEITVRGLV